MIIHIVSIAKSVYYMLKTKIVMLLVLKCRQDIFVGTEKTYKWGKHKRIKNYLKIIL